MCVGIRESLTNKWQGFMTSYVCIQNANNLIHFFESIKMCDNTLFISAFLICLSSIP